MTKQTEKNIAWAIMAGVISLCGYLFYISPPVVKTAASFALQGFLWLALTFAILVAVLWAWDTLTKN